MERAGSDGGAFVTQPLFGAAHCLVQRDQVGTAAVREFQPLEVVPDALVRVQVGHISNTWVSGDAVHTSPRNPFASAPRASNAGICARCSAPQTLADGGTTDAQRAGDVFLPPGPLVQLPGPLPSLLLRIHFGASRRCRR